MHEGLSVPNLGPKVRERSVAKACTENEIFVEMKIKGLSLNHTKNFDQEFRHEPEEHADECRRRGPDQLGSSATDTECLIGLGL